MRRDRTPLGRFLQKLRVDTGETIRDMADKLGVSNQFLSSLEVGKHRLPYSEYLSICELYKLKDKQLEEFTAAFAESIDYIKVNLVDANPKQKQLAVLFARELPKLNKDKALALIEFLESIS